MYPFYGIDRVNPTADKSYLRRLQLQAIVIAGGPTKVDPIYHALRRNKHKPLIADRNSQAAPGTGTGARVKLRRSKVVGSDSPPRIIFVTPDVR